MDGILTLIEKYGRLEQDVQCCMTGLGHVVCARCAARCCRIDFCRESLESVFLARVRARFAADARWDPAGGWLTAMGCSLSAGRPPVCYEFICSTLEDNQPTPAHRAGLQHLAMLLTRAGKNARGRRHLVEVDHLEKLNIGRLDAQIDQARSALERLQIFQEGQRRSLRPSFHMSGGGPPSAPSR